MNVNKFFLTVAVLAVLIASGCTGCATQQPRYSNPGQAQVASNLPTCEVGEKLQRNDSLNKYGCVNLKTGVRRILGEEKTCQDGERLQRNGSQTACFNPSTGTRRIL